MILIVREWVIWTVKNWRLALLVTGATLLAFMRIESASLRNRLDRAKANADGMKKEIEAHETRDEIDNRVAADRDPKRVLRRDWSE